VIARSLDCGEKLLSVLVLKSTEGQAKHTIHRAILISRDGLLSSSVSNGSRLLSLRLWILDWS
tara:strand:- start:408 stop:596 length:189 start_codon:yes stop_codon:yes gene_type:complete